jgi:hypothetical protein
LLGGLNKLFLFLIAVAISVVEVVPAAHSEWLFRRSASIARMQSSL